MGDANLGSLFRLADAFNIEKIVFCGSTVNFNSNRLKKTARSTYKTVDHEHLEDAEIALAQYISQGYAPIALEITGDSETLDSQNFKNTKKLLLVIGNESFGISPQLLERIKHKVHITMFGHNSSMNVAQAAGIALYEITKTLPPFREK